MTQQSRLTTIAASYQHTHNGQSYLDGLADRISNRESEIHAFVDPPEWNQVRRDVSRLFEEYPRNEQRPPLFGVPIGVKDIFHVDGFQTRAGSKLPPSVLETSESLAVRSLRNAGGVILGKTHTTEFACFEPAPTRNPHNLDHTPGGSSSGSAAAVAAGFCPVALGSQTVGSVIRPAAFCGVVGFKPSFNRIPMEGIVPVSESLDHVGIFTADLEDIEPVAAVLCDEWQPSIRGRVKPTIGIPDGDYLEQVSEVGNEAFEAQVNAIGASGFDVVRLEMLDDIAAINERHTNLMKAEMAIAHHEWYENHADEYRAGTAELIETGREIPAETIAHGRDSRLRLRDRLSTSADEHGIDVWLSPAAPGPAPATLDSTGDPKMNLPWTHAGLPTITLPAGEHNGLPMGIQCAAGFGADESLLTWARQLNEGLNHEMAY